MIIALLLACTAEVTVPISRSTIQAALDEKFPLKGGAEGLASLKLTNPVVVLPGDDRIGLTVDATAGWRDVPVREIAAEGMASLPQTGAPAEAAAQTLTVLEGALKRAREAEMISRRGIAGIEATLAYEDGAFYLYQSELTRLEIAGLGPEKSELARQSAQIPVAAALDRLPVYTLSADAKEKAARLVVREVKASSDEVQIILGLPQ